MFQRITAGACFALLGLLFVAPIHATPFPSLSMDVGVCDPNNPQNCVKPDSSGNMPVTGTFSATLNGFTPNGNYATLTATNSSASVALPTGTTVAFQNTGTTTVSCNLGVGSATATASQIIIQAASTVFVTPGSNTFGACIDQTGSTSNVVVLAGGAGLGTGFGGGSSSGGGGGTSAADASTFTTGTTPVSPMGGLFNDTATLTTGQVGAPRVTTKRAQIMDVDTTGNALYSAITAPIPAGTNLIGKVGIDQTTPGTTNGVQVNAALPAGTNLLGKTGIDQTTPGTTNAVSLVPGGSGGWTKFSTPKNNSNTALTTTVVAVKSSAAGIFGGYYISNPNASVACMQVFDVATAGGVTLGTTRPDMVFCIPASSAANFELANGAAMANGIQIAATTTASGSSAPGTGLDVTILYK